MKSRGSELLFLSETCGRSDGLRQCSYESFKITAGTREGKLTGEFSELLGRDFEARTCIGQVLSGASQQLPTSVRAIAYNLRNLIVVTIKDISQKKNCAFFRRQAFE